MNVNKILSIAIPTVNRKPFLELTLNQFIPQILRNADQVELVISNNASEDDTDEYLTDLISTYNCIRYFKSNVRLDLFDSFSKAVDNSTGKYVILWGDDDIPAPFLLETLLNVIDNNPNISIIHYNRLIGYNSGLNMKSLKVCNRTYEDMIHIYDNLSDFNNCFFYDETFMSTMVFQKEDWIKGLAYNSKAHYGFEFMGTIFYGAYGKSYLYLNYPLCIQRKPILRTWMGDWPLYGLLGIPNMVKDFEREGYYTNGYNTWYKTYNNLISYIYILICAAAYKKKYKPLCTEIVKHQKSIFRKFLCYIIIYGCPKWMYLLIRNIQFKTK